MVLLKIYQEICICVLIIDWGIILLIEYLIKLLRNQFKRKENIIQNDTKMTYMITAIFMKLMAKIFGIRFEVKFPVELLA